MRRLKWLGIAGMAVLVTMLAGPADAQQCPKGKLRIYTSWPMQGAMIPEGTGMKNGVDMAVAEAGGVVAGHCLEVVNLDDASPQTGKWDGAVEAENANRAVGDALAIAYIGTYNSGAAKVSIPITNRAHMAQITPANTYPGLTKTKGAAPGEPGIYRPMGFVNYFRIVPADDIQGAVGAKWAKQRGAKKIFIIHDQELYGKGIADVFDATAKKIGLQIVGNEGIDFKQPDQKPVLTKARAAGADLIYMGGVVDTGAPIVIRQMKDLGMVAARNVRFLGPDGLLEEEVLKGATCDAAMQTDMHITFASLPFEKLKGIGASTYENYKKKYSKEPTAYALYSVEAGRIAIEGIKRAAPQLDKAKDIKEKRDAVRQAILNIKNYDGLNGKWSFDENGDSTLETMSGFKVVKADNPIGCKFEFETILE
ncbi:MAG TPA: branched-chain amino acid ABC transporter substrate-binding protein [Methylomirabilota bacterium]|jgi:branched-chain amino acid transport system substrate-binding protein|nr:branched-chain amino acid ABC transporter substrate-binding protein [Methylomirabilota bacterium]